MLMRFYATAAAQGFLVLVLHQESNYYPMHYVPWENKTNKAAYFASLTDSRQLMFDLAASNPELFEARWTVGGVLEPWHPQSTEDSVSRNDVRKYLQEKGKEVRRNDSIEATTPGYTGHILHLFTPLPQPYNPSSFKYIVVLDGGFGDGIHYALSGRLASLLGEFLCHRLLILNSLTHILQPLRGR